MKTIHLDFETRSRVKLKDTNAHLYGKHPSTEVLCMAWAEDDGPINLWLPGDSFPFKRGQAARFMAWNAEFEYAIWNHVCTRLYDWPAVAPQHFHCTQVLSAYYGYPRKLESSARIFNLEKDMAGHKIMVELASPKKAKLVNGVYVGGAFAVPTPDEWGQLCRYCEQDVEVERGITKCLPPLPDLARRHYLANFRVNLTGIPIDIDFCHNAKAIHDKEMEAACARLSVLTGGTGTTPGAITTPNQRDRIINFLENEGIYLDDLRNSTVTANVDRHEILAIRNVSNNAAPKKYAAILRHVEEDNCCRNQYKSYGAHTGRASGSGVQFQNFMKRRAKADPMMIESIRAGDRKRVAELSGGRPIQAISEYLRSVIVPFPGEKLVVADLSQIEARITFWLAGEKEDFSGIYERMAADIYKVSAATIGKDSDERQLGKCTVLGSGFGMGPDKFVVQAKEKYGVTIDRDFAQMAIEIFRHKYKKIIALWNNLSAACRYAFQHQENKVAVGKLIFGFEEPKSIFIQLPSGRRLYYRNIEEQTDSVYGKPVLVARVGSKPVKLTRSILIENPVQAIAADIFLHAVENLQAAAHKIIGYSHDEVILSCPKDVPKDDIERFMSEVPAWSAGLSVASEVQEKNRYYE